MTLFATLGPAGSNHELVTRRYLAKQGLDHARVELVNDFADAIARYLAGEVQFIVQCAAHAAVADTVGADRERLILMDTFMAPSHPLAVLTRSDVREPRSIALHPATRPWVDLSPWPEVIEEVSTATVAQGLQAARYDSGVTAAALADDQPGRFRVDRMLGSVCDAWLVYGPEPACTGDILFWPDAPGARAIRRLAGPGEASA